MLTSTVESRKILGVCLKGQASGDSWPRLFEAANHESILPAVAAALTNGSQRLPSDVHDFLTAALSLNRNRNLRIRRELIDVAQLLNEIGIQPVLLKGSAYLASGVYSDPASRYLLDVDLLLPPAQLPLAVQHLLQNGFAQDEIDQFGIFRHHHPPLHRGIVQFELHHQLGLGACESILPAAEVISNSTKLHLDGAVVRIPSPTHLLTHLVMHSQIVHPYNERIWPPLRAMYDLVCLERHFGSAIDWSEVENRFKHAGELGLLHLHLIDVRDSLEFEPPIRLNLTPLTRTRHLRRRSLRQFPALRYLDPLYMASTLLTRRLRILKSMLSKPGGLRHFLTQLCNPYIYQRFFTDVLEGRGR